MRLHYYLILVVVLCGGPLTATTAGQPRRRPFRLASRLQGSRDAEMAVHSETLGEEMKAGQAAAVARQNERTRHPPFLR